MTYFTPKYPRSYTYTDLQTHRRRFCFQNYDSPKIGWKRGHEADSPHWLHYTIWSYLHTRACHSLPVIEKRWKAAYDRFERAHYGSRQASPRFVNRYTAHGFN